MTAAPPVAASELLAERVLTVAATTADGGHADAVARRVFDTLGALSAATALEGGDHLGMLPAGRAGDGLLGEVRRASATIRASELDDIEIGSCTTPGAVAVPVALGLAASASAGAGVSGGGLLAAVAAGYEAMVAVGEAIDGSRVLSRGIWPSYLAAPLAAAATAGCLLGLSREQLVDALAIAAARVAGAVGRPDRDPTSRWLLFGCAAADGVAAALAAADGVAGDPDLLGAVLAAHAGEQLRAIGPAAGRPAAARVDVKPFCTARQALPGVEAARAAWAAAGGADVSAIEAVEVGVPEAYRAMIDQPRPADRLSSIMSAQFQIAAALHAPERLYDVVRARQGLDETGTRLMAVVRVAADPELSPLFPRVWAARVRLRLADGRVLERCAPTPGDSGAPERRWAWLLDKQRRLGASPGHVQALADACRALAAEPVACAPALLELALSAPTHDPVAPPGGLA